MWEMVTAFPFGSRWCGGGRFDVNYPTSNLDGTVVHIIGDNQHLILSSIENILYILILDNIRIL